VCVCMYVCMYIHVYKHKLRPKMSNDEKIHIGVASMLIVLWRPCTRCGQKHVNPVIR